MYSHIKSEKQFQGMLKQVRDQGRELYLDTYSPGDGVTRYRFSCKDGDYFGWGDGCKLATCLGLAEARVWFHGFVMGALAEKWWRV